MGGVALSTPLLHLAMVRSGWDHDRLMAMDEEEFLYWAEVSAEYDDALNEACSGG